MGYTKQCNGTNDLVTRFQKLDEFHQYVVSALIDHFLKEEKYSSQNKIIERKKNVLTVDFRK